MPFSISPSFPLRIQATRWGYQHLAKPFFFQRDPEDVHDHVTATGAWMGSHNLPRMLLQSWFGYEHPALAQDILGIHFSNPLGLAAGFDKNARIIPAIAGVGFGFEEIGSVTGEPCAGNPRPRLWRLPNSKSLAVYYGLKNDGCEIIASRLAAQTFPIPVGISLAKTNSPQTVHEAEGIRDYVKAARAFIERGIGQYFTINISCPNAFGGEPFTDPARLDHLLSAITALPSSKPLFLKLPADLPFDHLDLLVDVARRYHIRGLICTNMTKNHKSNTITDAMVPPKGGLSGKPVEPLSNRMIEYLYRKNGHEFVLVGCGGVFSAEDAYQKIRLGASLIQLITGMIFEGPQLIHEIKRGLVALLARDGYKDISQAIGSSFSTPSSKRYSPSPQSAPR
jgi:dihydroorotate dehydrogenase subfamily 2